MYCYETFAFLKKVPHGQYGKNSKALISQFNEIDEWSWLNQNPWWATQQENLISFIGPKKL